MSQYYNNIRKSFMYRIARFYCFSCGFSVTPLKPRSKQQVIRNSPFQDRLYPCDHHLVKFFVKANYQIAICPGEISGGLVILDFDEPGSFKAWHRATGIDTPRVISKRGTHVYVRLKEPLLNGWGVFQGQKFGDIIAHGNITAPPSLHPSGHQYRWEGDPRAVPLFPCLASLGVERKNPDGGKATKRKPAPTPSVRSGTVYGVNLEYDSQGNPIKNKEAYIMAAIRKECGKVANGQKGSRNHLLYRAALNLAKFTSVVSRSTIEDDLKAAALRAGMNEQKDSIRAAIKSGLDKGIVRGVIEA